jgi:hypothetical protein
MPVIPVYKVVDPKRIIRNKWRAEEEERHKGPLTAPPQKKKQGGQFYLGTIYQKHKMYTK